MKSLMLGLLLVFSFSAFSEEESSEPVEDVRLNSLEDVNVFMDNVGNRFVYAFFGRDMLVYYLSDPEHRIIAEEADVAVLNIAAAPFNPQMYQFFVSSMFKIIYFVSIAYFLVRLFVFVFEMGWLTKREGVMPLKDGEFRQFSSRFVLLSGLILYPMVGNFTGIQVGVFDVYGTSAEFANRATTEIIDSQRQAVTTVRLPRSDAKHDSGLALNTFFTCLRLSDIDDTSIALSMVKDDATKAFWGTVGAKDCHLEVTVGYDDQTDEAIKQIKRTFPEFEVSEDAVYNAQLDVFPEMLNSIFSMSYQFSETLVKVRQHTSGRDMGEMEQWTEHGSVSFTNTYWEGACESFYEWDFPNVGITKAEMQAYHFMSSRCISYEVNKKLLYPSEYGNVAKFLADEVLQNREIMLCHDSLSVIDPVLGVYAGIGTPSGNNEVSEIGLSACIFKQCSDSGLKSGGLYTCANAVSLYKRAVTDQRIKDMGAFVLGAYMFSLYTQPPLSDVSKNIFNGFALKFSTESFSPPPTLGADEGFSIDIAVPPKTANHSGQKDVLLTDLMMSYLYDDVNSAMGASEGEGFSLKDLLYLDRLSTCVRHPLEVSNGYVCGNVPQEVNKWGMNLIYFSANFKTMLAVGDAYRRMSFSLSKRLEGGSVGSQSISRNPSEAMRTAAAGALSIMGMSSESAASLNILGVTYNVDDGFGHLQQSQSTVMNFLSNPIVGYLVSSMDDKNSTMMGMLDFILGVIFLVGFFLGVLIPFMPVMLFITALGMSVFLLFKFMMLSSFKITDIIFSMDSEFMSHELEQLFAEVLAMALKIPLTIVGVIVAWLMSNVLVSKIMLNLDLETLFNLNSVASANGHFDAFVIFLVTSVVLFAVFSTVISVIESFYEFTVKWAVGDMPSNPFDSEKSTMNWAETKQSFKHMISK
jgi:hypothetical protein